MEESALAKLREFLEERQPREPTIEERVLTLAQERTIRRNYQRADDWNEAARMVPVLEMCKVLGILIGVGAAVAVPLIVTLLQ